MHNSKKELSFNLHKKITEKNLDLLIDTFYRKFSTNGSSSTYIFDFSDVEWIANEELLVLTGMFKSLVDSQISLRILFLKNGSSKSINERKARQFVELWEVWKIYQIVPHKDYKIFFDIDGNTIQRLRLQFGISSASKTIYESYGVTPFVILEHIESYDDRKIIEKLSDTYILEAATNEILRENNCYLPFKNQTLSSIVSKELYENFLDHFKQSVFGHQSNQAFLSLVLKKKIDSERLESFQVQSILKRNFEEESIPELKSFYVDKNNQDFFINRSVLQFSFVDFGEGIPVSLKNAYFKNSGSGFSLEHDFQNEDTKILEFAFKHDSSQHELINKYKEEFAVPRGLFDLLSIVKRFEGVIIARSNYGKIAFEFSGKKKIEESVRYFGDQSKFFPGTLFTIYIPERNLETDIESTSIKPYDSLPNYSFAKEEVKHISLFHFQADLKSKNLEKKDFYNTIFNTFLKEIQSNSLTLIYLDFTGWEIDERVTRKIIFFLCTDYRVNLKNNVIAINPPSKAFLSSIKDELLTLEEIDRKFKIHPTPFIFNINNILEIFWLGIFSEKDIEKLNNLLFEEHDLRSSDFENPEAIIGHINHYDKYGNLISIIDSSKLKLHYLNQSIQIENEEIVRIITPCIKTFNKAIFLCNGNYYQYEYLQLIDALSNKDSTYYLNSILLKRIRESIIDLKDHVFVGITSSSHKLIDFFENELSDVQARFLRLNNYSSFEEEEGFKQFIQNDSKVILLCDVISTGFMVNKLISNLEIVGASLKQIGVLVNAIDVNNENFKSNYKEIISKTISVYEKPLKKYTRNEISQKLQNGILNVIRINPFTNTPILQELNKSNNRESVLLSNEEFIKLISIDHIKVGFFNFNSLIHPYFFDMHSILKNSIVSEKLVAKVFELLEKRTSLAEIEIIFYPKSSGIQNIDFNFLENKIFKRHNIKFFELERFQTNEGWRFPHPPQSLIETSLNKNVMILDDGSCSGESISQMIDEVAFLNVKSLVVVSLVGRLNDHKREFFSRIKNIANGEKDIPVKIFFGSNWHIPTYHLSKSPVIEENKWLDQLIDLPNVPQEIKSIVKTIKKEIVPRKITEGNSYYLLKTKEGKSIHDEMSIVRDEFGKIAEFRFYKEYFKYFDEFIAYHESKKLKDRGRFPYKKIETVCAIFLHEPYLYDKVKVVIPDVIERIEEFVKLLVIDQKILRDKLCYEWDKKDMIHLLFIIFKNENLLKIIDINKFKKLLIFLSDSQSSLNYILYKILKYFPLTNSEIKIKRLDNHFKTLFENVNTGNYQLDKQIKKYNNFLKTLPSRSDLESQLRTLKENYNKEKAPELHDGKISFNHNISLILGQVRNSMDIIESGEEPKRKLADSIVKSWFQLMNFINPILTFSITFEEYLAPYPYFKFINSTERDSGSLRSLVGTNQELIFRLDETLNDFEKLKLIEKNIILIQTNFSLNSEFHELVENRDTEWKDFFSNFKLELSKLNVECSFEIKMNEDERKIKIPKSYSQKLIIEELIANLKNHCKKGEETKIKVIIQEISVNQVQIKITNPIAEIGYSNSNGEGTKCLNLLASSEYFGFSYKYKIDEVNFIQKLNFALV